MADTKLSGLSEDTTPEVSDSAYSVSGSTSYKTQWKYVAKETQACGGIYLALGPTSNTFDQTHGGSAEKITQFRTNLGIAHKVTESHSTDSLRVTEAGVYWIGFIANFDLATNRLAGALVSTGPTLGSTTNQTYIRSAASGQGTGSHESGACAGAGPVSLSANDYIELWGFASAASTTVGWEQLLLTCHRLYPT